MAKASTLVQAPTLRRAAASSARSRAARSSLRPQAMGRPLLNERLPPTPRWHILTCPVLDSRCIVWFKDAHPGRPDELSEGRAVLGGSRGALGADVGGSNPAASDGRQALRTAPRRP